MTFSVDTKGHGDIIDITGQISDILKSGNIQEGLAVIFIAGATAAITTMEYENGLILDMKEALEKIAPESADYRHHRRWGDHNGAAHIKAALIGPSLTIPIAQGRLLLGAWQQIVLIDFDEKPREREIIVRISAN